MLPKLRGLELLTNERCFEDIREVLEELDDDELVKAYSKATDTNNNNLFAWTGVTRKQES